MSSSAPAPASARLARVLLVEDDDLMRRSFTVALERYGYRMKARRTASPRWSSCARRASTC